MEQLKSFEQTHWLREYVAFCIASDGDRNQEFSYWQKITPKYQKIYRKIADERILAFKAAVEAAQGVSDE
jgi:hypothetical protein